MVRFFLFAALGASLYIFNPGLEEFESTARAMVKKEESSFRAGWNSVAKVTGINALAGAVGMGSFEACRHNLYVASLFSVRTGKSLGSDTVAVGAGALDHFVIRTVAEPGQENSLLVMALLALSEIGAPTECNEVHKDGSL